MFGAQVFVKIFVKVNASLYSGISVMMPTKKKSRNNWMIDHSDYVIAYIRHTFGGAYQAVERAKKKGKILIQIR